MNYTSMDTALKLAVTRSPYLSEVYAVETIRIKHFRQTLMLKQRNSNDVPKHLIKNKQKFTF